MPGLGIGIGLDEREYPSAGGGAPAVQNFRFIRWTVTARKGGGSGNIQAADFELLLEGTPISYDVPATRSVPSASFPHASQQWRYLRLTITETRDVGSSTTQLNEFQVLQNGTPVAWPGGTTATNPSGAGADVPANAIDGNTSGTKWGDTNLGTNGSSVLLIDTGVGNSVTFNSYRFYTGNDSVGRDPFMWQLHGSNNNTDFTLIHNHTYVDGLPASGGEQPMMLVDENSGTKWNDGTFNGTSAAYVFEWQFADTIGFDAYRYRTANDVEARDPVSWTLEGSDDKSAWTLIDTRTNETITASRTTYTQTFTIP